MAERDARIALAMMQLERGLENEMTSSTVAAQAKSALAETIRAFRVGDRSKLNGLTVQVRPTLAMLGLEPPPIPSEPEGSVALWFLEITGWIGSLPLRLRQVLRMEGEHAINLVGNLILTRVHRFAPNFLFARIFERLGDDMARRVAEETAQAAVAVVVALLLLRVSRLVPRA
jgi:hypothetical protein